MLHSAAQPNSVLPSAAALSAPACVLWDSAVIRAGAAAMPDHLQARLLLCSGPAWCTAVQCLTTVQLYVPPCCTMQYVPAMMDPILGDYARNNPDAR